ncbi:DMT family transporter [Candidatus Falkowbacteria bacterium]|nr:DMT family transporter [Candidatus Falkowbacteria bacterium]
MLRNKKKIKKIIGTTLLMITILILVFGLVAIVNAQGTSETATPTTTTPTTSDSTAQTNDSKTGGLITAKFQEAVEWLSNSVRALALSLLLAVMRLLVKVSTYNKFIDTPAVKSGWTAVRDVVNMFFILGLLLIAFATVLKIEKYGYNKFLGRLLIMAILVNFSRTICGLIIDAFQVLMLSFVNGYQQSLEPVFTRSFNIDQSLKYSNCITGSETVDKSGMTATASFASALFAIIYTVVSLIIIAVFLIILTFRIIMLWMLVIFSPLAFFAWTFEGAGKLGEMSSRWWKMFFEYCMVGPFLAFFLWLSVSTLNNLSTISSEMAAVTEDNVCQSVLVTQSQGGRIDNVMGFVISILLLVAGLKFTGEFKVVGASAASGAADWMKKQTAGRVENYARRAGAAAAGVAALPTRAVKTVGLATTQGISDRMRDVRGLRYLTKEGRKEAVDLASAKIRSAVGPRKMMVERTYQELEEKDVKRKKAEGAFLDPTTWRKEKDAAVKRGDMRDARAMMAEGARQGWVDSEDVDSFRTKFRGKMGERRMFEFSEQLSKDYKKETGRHLRTNDMYITEEGLLRTKTKTPAEEYKNAVGRMNFKDQGQMAEQSKAFRSQIDPETGVERNKYWKEELLAYADQSSNFGHYNPLARTNLANAVQEIVKDPKKLAKFNEDERRQLNKIHEAATAEYAGRTGLRKGPAEGGRGKLAIGGEENKPSGLAGEYQVAAAEAAVTEKVSPPPAPKAGRIGKIAERVMKKENYDKLMAIKGQPVERAKDLVNSNLRAVKQWIWHRPINKKGEYIAPKPIEPKEIPGIIDKDQMKEFIDQQSQTGGQLYLGPDESKFENPKEVQKNIAVSLQAKGVKADVAENRAGQIVRYKEDLAKYHASQHKTHTEVLSNLDMAKIPGFEVGSGEIELESLPGLNQTELDQFKESGAKGEIKKKLDEAIYKTISVFKTYTKQMAKKGAKFNEEQLKNYNQRLKELEQFARTRADLEKEEVQAIVDDIEATMASIYGGLLEE